MLVEQGPAGSPFVNKSAGRCHGESCMSTSLIQQIDVSDNEQFHALTGSPRPSLVHLERTKW